MQQENIVTPAQCPSCGGTQFVNGINQFEGSVYISNSYGDSVPHLVEKTICTDCNTIVQSNIVKKNLCSCPCCK
jgi:predicted Zn-ribbon and HTH transcriptional regulator